MPVARHLKFPSIDQFRSTVKSVRDRAAHHQVPLPTLTFHGTVKLHGTNAGAVMDVPSEELWAQSREQLITLEKDNAGFARFVDTWYSVFRFLGQTALKQDTLGLQNTTHVGIFGEWCGQGIMKGVAISQVPKMFVIFGIALYDVNKVYDDGDTEKNWLPPDVLSKVVRASGHDTKEVPIFCINDFPTFSIDIDFARPELAQAKLVELTSAVDKECPVGLHFGVSGVGEGIVWTCFQDGGKIQTADLIFKVKGEKHSETKVKTLADVDVEKMNSIHEFVTRVVTEHRMEKMVEKMKENGDELLPQNTPIFLKLIGQDVIKEESDTMEASGLPHKDVMPAVNRAARQWFITLVNKV